RAGELELLRSRLAHLSPQDFQAVEAALRAAVNKLLHRPIVHLRCAAASGNGYHEVESIRAIFGLDEASETGREGDGATGRRGDGENDTVEDGPASDRIDFAGSPRPPVAPSPPPPSPPPPP